MAKKILKKKYPDGKLLVIAVDEKLVNQMIEKEGFTPTSKSVFKKAKAHQKKMALKGATPKGILNKIRGITKDHSIYSEIFDDKGEYKNEKYRPSGIRQGKLLKNPDNEL